MYDLWKFYKYHFPWISAPLIRIPESQLMSSAEFARPVIDIGCGDGMFALFTYGSKIVDIGIDIDFWSTEQGPCSPYSKRLVQDIHRMDDFEDGSISTVLSNSVLEHVDNIEVAIQEIARITRKGGKLYFTLPTSEIRRYFWSFALFKDKNRAEMAFLEYNQALHHINLMSTENWERLLSRYGFEIQKKVNYITPTELFFHSLCVSLGIKKIPLHKRYNKVFGLMQLIRDANRVVPLVKYALYIPLYVVMKWNRNKQLNFGSYIFVEAVKQ